MVALLLRPSGGSEAADAATPSPSPTGGDTVVTVPAACKEASDNLQQATMLLNQVVGSVRDFEPKELVRLLNRLEDLDNETRPLVRQCSDVRVSTSASPSPSQ